MSNTSSIVSRVWSFCNFLRDDGVSYGDYLEQLTYLLFLKMADEYAKPPYNRDIKIPAAYNWESLRSRRGAELETHYVTLLRELGQQTGMLGEIFFKAQNRIQDPAKLYKVIQMIDDESWVMMGADVKGDIYEGLLEKNAEDTKSGAGETVRKKLMQNTDLHTILRLPTGLFYAGGKANVIFFDNKPAQKAPWTKAVWIYDFRTNVDFTQKKNSLRFEDLQEFIQCYNPPNRHKRTETWSADNPEGRWRKFTCDEILARDKTSLNIFWLKDKSLADLDNLPDPDVLAREIVENLEAGLASFRELLGELEGR